MKGMVSIQMVNVSKRYTTSWRGAKVEALRDLNLEVKAGEVFGLLGPNGSGKSTTLKIILGLVEATSGQVQVLGSSIRRLATRQRIGFLPESPYFYRFLTGEELLYFCGRLCGVPKTKLSRRVDELLVLVGLEKGARRALNTYSKGMLQRIGLAQALVHDPELVLLDEPTAGVDPLGSRDIKDLILRLKQAGKTVVLSSHWLDQVEEVCDRVAILHEGQKVLEGDLKDLLAIKDETQLVVKHFQKERESEVRRALEQLHVEWVEAKSVKRDLESLFVERVSK
ncbi:MAG: ABC transporter ATP-binding protein [Verrucomicrobiae bacterium]|nr:ABC transporter ATP-binding protein [Verrucomicrobiae bacterium]